MQLQDHWSYGLFSIQDMYFPSAVIIGKMYWSESPTKLLKIGTLARVPYVICSPFRHVRQLLKFVTVYSAVYMYRRKHDFMSNVACG